MRWASASEFIFIVFAVLTIFTFVLSLYANRKLTVIFKFDFGKIKDVASYMVDATSYKSDINVSENTWQNMHITHNHEDGSELVKDDTEGSNFNVTGNSWHNMYVRNNTGESKVLVDSASSVANDVVGILVSDILGRSINDNNSVDESNQDKD